MSDPLTEAVARRLHECEWPHEAARLVLGWMREAYYAGVHAPDEGHDAAAERVILSNEREERRDD